MNIGEESLRLHQEKKGKLATMSKVKLETKKDLSLAYTPGVAEVCKAIAQDENKLYEYTSKGNLVAVISDGSAVLGLGNIGSKASLPVMEGKSILLKEFGGIDSIPIIITEQNTQKTIDTIKNIAGSFGGINLEDFKAPECFAIEEGLQNLGIPVMHDDQHGTAIVVLAGLINAIKLKGITKEEAKILLNGAGAAGIAITKLLLSYGFKKIAMVDTEGAIYEGRENLNPIKQEIARITNKTKLKGPLHDVIKGADIFIGVSKGNILTSDMIRSMAPKPIIFALANPTPEIMPEEATKAGVFIIATGRSDYPNQVNNVLAFPGIFKGALQIRAKRITEPMKLAAAQAIAEMVTHPTPEQIIPEALNKNVAEHVSQAVMKAYKE